MRRSATLSPRPNPCSLPAVDPRTNGYTSPWSRAGAACRSCSGAGSASRWSAWSPPFSALRPLSHKTASPWCAVPLRRSRFTAAADRSSNPHGLPAANRSQSTHRQSRRLRSLAGAARRTQLPARVDVGERRHRRRVPGHQYGLHKATARCTVAASGYRAEPHAKAPANLWAGRVPRLCAAPVATAGSGLRHRPLQRPVGRRGKLVSRQVRRRLARTMLLAGLSLVLTGFGGIGLLYINLQTRPIGVGNPLPVEAYRVGARALFSSYRSWRALRLRTHRPGRQRRSTNRALTGGSCARSWQPRCAVGSGLRYDDGTADRNVRARVGHHRTTATCRAGFGHQLPAHLTRRTRVPSGAG